jgi:hypothetical protein
MKRMAMVLVVLFLATSVFAGGKECNLKSGAKNVELTGSLVTSGSGDEAKTVFRVANSSDSYNVCHKSKASALKLGAEANTTLQVKGKVVSCGEGQELMIESAKKV